MCLCVCVLLLLVLTPSSEGKKQREQVRRMGDEFFRGIDEEKQRYVKAGGKLLKETTNSCLNKSKQNPESTITKNFCLHISKNSSSFFCKFSAPNEVLNMLIFLKDLFRKKIKSHVYIFLIPLSFSSLDSYQMNITSSLFNV